MQQRTSSQLTVRDAAYHTVRGYPGGAGSLAPRMGLSAQVLNHKTNPTNETRYNLSIEEAVQLQELSGNYSILYAMARQLGHHCLKDDGGDSPCTVNERIAVLLGDFGDLLADVSDIVADGKVTDNEMRRAEDKFNSLMGHANELHALLKSKNAELHQLRAIGGQ